MQRRRSERIFVDVPVLGENNCEQSEKESECLTGGKETILIVDDDPSIRKLIKDILQPVEYRLLFANDGDDALNIVRKDGPVDVLLTDVIMPNMNGRQLAGIFLRDYPGVKTRFISGYADETISC